MKRANYVAMAFVGAILAGCVTTFHPWDLSKIEPGMTKEQVIAILGKPSDVKQSGDFEWLEYTYTESPVVAPLEGSGLNFDQKYPFFEKQIEREMQTYRYAVELQNGKVVSYKEIR